jgi:UDP-arabinose 4-epimerase
MTTKQTDGACLVAGGAGYIGSHTSKQLLKEGLTPVVVDDLSNGHQFAVKYGPFIEASIADKTAVRKAIQDHGIQSAILFAAHIEVGESTRHPRKYFQNNVARALDFLDAFLDAGGRYIVFSSSCAIYGLQTRIPISEDSSKSPASPYAHTKLMIEHILESYDRAYGLRSACLRYFNAAGADTEGELGECHQPESHLIPLALEAVLSGKPLNVFGTDYETPDGTALRDYIHVNDLARAHVAALRKLLEGGPSMQVNLGTGKGYSVKEVIQMVEKVTGRPVPVTYAPRRDGDVPALVSDPRLSQQLLGWQPKCSDLETIVRTAWLWRSEKGVLCFSTNRSKL